MTLMLFRGVVGGAIALVAACVALLGLAAQAAAHRQPTRSEHRAIRRAVDRACEELADGARCRGARGIRVSTADSRFSIGSPRWTNGFPAYYRAGLKRSHGRWRVVWEEVNDLNVLTCAEYRDSFPNAVIEDFGLEGFPGGWGAAPPVPCWR